MASTAAPTARPFTITVQGQPARTARTFADAEVTMGQMMNDAEVGTLGLIAGPDGVAEVAMCDTFGWTVVPEATVREALAVLATA